jgi:hypothetical protein
MGLRNEALAVTRLQGAAMSFSAFASCRLSHGRRGLEMVCATGAIALLGLGLASPGALADTCGNAGLRALNDSAELPDCRAYEMVSSAYKEGFDLIPRTFADDGIVSYISTGSFAGNGLGFVSNEYLGVRTAGGWETRSLNPPGALYNTNFEAPLVFASDLRSSVMAVEPRDQSGDGNGFYVRDFDGTFTRVGQGPAPYAGVLLVSVASDDLSHVVFGDWEYTGVGGAAVLRRVPVDNNGAPVPGTSCPGGISGDGRVVVFFSGCDGMQAQRVWARVGGTATVAVSGSECTRGSSDPRGMCNALSSAQYVGGSVDGSRLFITTDQQLVNADTDSTTDLYACDIPGSLAPVGVANPCAALTEVSGGSDGARVESVVTVSEDGSRAYFMAKGALAGNPGIDGVTAVSGEDNLYSWVKDAAHPTGTTRFVTRLDSSGVAGAQATKDGRYLVFSTTTKLVSSGPGKDEDERADMYRYDAESETMLRLSTSVTGVGGNAGSDAASRRSSRRSASNVSADGSMVVFETDEALSPDDTDGVADVYLWREGRVSLISRGGGQLPWISSTGDDIFFVTSQRLTAADGDVNVDIYDARVGGGFDLTQPVPCSRDACQGPASAPPGLQGSVPRGPGGNVSEAAPALSLRRVSSAQRKRLAATGKVDLVVSASAAGVLRAVGTATIGGRSITVALARRNLTMPGMTTMSLTLSKRARTQLATRRMLTVRVAISHSKIALDRSVTLTVVRPSAKGSAKRAGTRQPTADGGARS